MHTNPDYYVAYNDTAQQLQYMQNIFHTYTHK